jgi:hypothetical protein
VVTNVTSLEKQAFNTQTIFWGQQKIMIDNRTEYLELYSNQGALLWSNQNNKNSMVLPYESLRPALYFLKVNSTERQITLRLMK